MTKTNRDDFLESDVTVVHISNEERGLIQDDETEIAAGTMNNTYATVRRLCMLHSVGVSVIALLSIQTVLLLAVLVAVLSSA